ncbi:MAG: hypothetical protein EA411_10765 [Saprospirales bacterium]|nr:MAG: hypothetical protein EA411_10765 [Saprospirales bacterium]
MDISVGRSALQGWIRSGFDEGSTCYGFLTNWGSACSGFLIKGVRICRIGSEISWGKWRI